MISNVFGAVMGAANLALAGWYILDGQTGPAWFHGVLGVLLLLVLVSTGERGTR